MNRRNFTLGLAAPAASVALLNAAWAQSPTPLEGREFLRVESPQPVSTPGKIEVLEFFSYACPHCNALEPALETWVDRLPPFVAFRRVPVPFLANMENFQRTYYALESLGLVQSMQGKVFQAVHVEHQRLDTLEDVAALISRNGGDGARFLAACKSFSVATSCSRAKKLTADFGVASFPGVPSLAIQGRFVTSPAQAGSGAKALAVADFLIVRVHNS
jgi:thiol:disulfide interchange protein DsbA